jgi:Tfp pilus assembly protein PilX
VSAGIAGIITALVGVAKYRTDVQQQRVVSAAQMRTVAAEEAEAAMRIMGETVDRANAETRRIAAQVEVMRADLDECLEAQRRMKGG